MIASNLGEVVQLAIGAVMGTAVSINLSRFGISLMDPETRWKAAGIIGVFLFSFLALTDLLLS